MLGDIKDKIKFSYLNELKEKDFFSTLDIFFAFYLNPKEQEEALFLAYLFLISRFGFVSLEINEDSIYPNPRDLKIETLIADDSQEFIKKVILGSKNLSDNVVYRDENENFPKYPVCKFQNFYYLQKNYVFETKIIKNLKNLVFQKPENVFFEDKFFKILENENFLNLEQKKAIENAFQNSFSLILGGPGTGKTYVAAHIIDILSKSLDSSKKETFKIVLTSFTGKATSHLKSKILRSTKDIQIKAKTLHLLLHLREEKTNYFDEKKLNYDLIIVDEASMLDLKLTAHLLESIKEGARVIFIGDPYQLPPIESGSIFAEIANIKNIKTAHLREAHRFENTKILDIANAIKKADDKSLDDLLLSNSCFYDLENANLSKKIILDIFLSSFIKPTSNEMKIDEIFENLQDFKILSAIKKGPFGVETLNFEIFSHLYSKTQINDYLFVPIMISKNNYNLDLFNGQIGILQIQKTIDGPSKKKAFFQIDDKIISFEAFCLNYEYAYSISIHKSQGSEFKKVIIVIPDGSEKFGKELFYTALTRAKNEFFIFSTKKIIKGLIKVSSFKKSALSSLEIKTHY